MSKIDIDKFVASVYKHEVQKLPSGGQWSTTLWTLDEVLREQGLRYKAGEIVEIEPKLSNVSENGKNSKPANLSKSSKFLQALVNEEIKRRCDAIDVNKMADEYYDALVKEAKMDERMAGHCRLGYYLGIEDTIKKLKTK